MKRAVALLLTMFACSTPGEPIPAPDINGRWGGCTESNVCLVLALNGTDSTRVWGNGLVAQANGATHRVLVTGGFDNHSTGLVALAICPDTSGFYTEPLPDCFIFRGSVRVALIPGYLYGNGLAHQRLLLEPPVQQ
jgi:hypothetical protein